MYKKQSLRSFFIKKLKKLKKGVDISESGGIIRPTYEARVAQLDRVPGYEPGGRRFESSRARQLIDISGIPPVLILF